MRISLQPLVGSYKNVKLNLRGAYGSYSETKFINILNKDICQWKTTSKYLKETFSQITGGIFFQCLTIYQTVRLNIYL